jgi:hypothetical protein
MYIAYESLNKQVTFQISRVTIPERISGSKIIQIVSSLKYSSPLYITINIHLPTCYPQLPKPDQNKEKRARRSKKDIPQPPCVLTPAAKEQKSSNVMY